MLKKYLLYYRLYTHIFSKLSPFTTSEKGVLLLCALPFLFNGLFLYLELTSVPSSFFVVSKIVSCFILLGRTLENYFEVNSICPLVNENPGDFFVAQKFVKYALFIRSSAVGGGLALATYTWNLQIEHFVVQRNFNVTQKSWGIL